MSLQDFELKLSMKNRRIEHLHAVGRISNEEYEKWILSEDIDFEPKIMSEDEAKEGFRKKWLEATGNQPLQFIESPKDKTIELLEKILKEVKNTNILLEQIRRK